MRSVESSILLDQIEFRMVASTSPRVAVRAMRQGQNGSPIRWGGESRRDMDQPPAKQDLRTDASRMIAERLSDSAAFKAARQVRSIPRLHRRPIAECPDCRTANSRTANLVALGWPVHRLRSRRRSRTQTRSCSLIESDARTRGRFVAAPTAAPRSHLDWTACRSVVARSEFARGAFGSPTPPAAD